MWLIVGFGRMCYLIFQFLGLPESLSPLLCSCIVSYLLCIRVNCVFVISDVGYIVLYMSVCVCIIYVVYRSYMFISDYNYNSFVSLTNKKNDCEV